MKKITLITATLNSEKVIGTLAQSITKQSDNNFNWIIQDGLSDDKTLEILKNYNIPNLTIYSEKDTGIYDAFNKALSNCDTEYYLVVGSDDILEPDAIKNYNYHIKLNKPDIVASRWRVGNKIYRPFRNLGWLKGMNGLSSSHSVATLIKKNLHERFGYYSLKFPICADALFIKICIYNGANISYADFISGTFTVGGFSSKNKFKTLKEQYEIQKLTEKNILLQNFIYRIKLIKHRYFVN